MTARAKAIKGMARERERLQLVQMLNIPPYFTSHKSWEKLKMLKLQCWPYSLFLLLVLLSASVQAVFLPGWQLQLGAVRVELREALKVARTTHGDHVWALNGGNGKGAESQLPETKPPFTPARYVWKMLFPSFIPFRHYLTLPAYQL